MNLLGAQTLVFAAVPFDQVAIDFRSAAEASQLAGPGGALQGTCKYPSEATHPELVPELSGVALAAIGER
jgi:hypothetical protein